jgi:hypothetical protein
LIKRNPAHQDRVPDRGLHADQDLYFKEIKDFGGGIVRPSVMETDSPLYKGYRSVMLFAKSRRGN